MEAKPGGNPRHRVYSYSMDPLDCSHCRVGSLVSSLAKPDPLRLTLNKSDMIWLRMIGSQIRNMKTLAAYTKLSFPKQRYRRGKLRIDMVRSPLPKMYLRWWGRTVNYLYEMARKERLSSRARYLVCESAAIILNEALNRYMDTLPDLNKSWSEPEKRQRCRPRKRCECGGGACACTQSCECGCPCECQCQEDMEDEETQTLDFPQSYEGKFPFLAPNLGSEQLVRRRHTLSQHPFPRAAKETRVRRASAPAKYSTTKVVTLMDPWQQVAAVKDTRRRSTPYHFAPGRKKEETETELSRSKMLRSKSAGTVCKNGEKIDPLIEIMAKRHEHSSVPKETESAPSTTQENQGAHNLIYYSSYGGNLTRNARFGEAGSRLEQVPAEARKEATLLQQDNNPILEEWIQFLIKQPRAVLDFFKENPQELQNLMQHEEGALQRFRVISNLLQEQEKADKRGRKARSRFSSHSKGRKASGDMDLCRTCASVTTSSQSSQQKPGPELPTSTCSRLPNLHVDEKATAQKADVKPNLAKRGRRCLGYETDDECSERSDIDALEALSTTDGSYFKSPAAFNLSANMLIKDDDSDSLKEAAQTFLLSVCRNIQKLLAEHLPEFETFSSPNSACLLRQLHQNGTDRASYSGSTDPYDPRKARSIRTSSLSPHHYKNNVAGTNEMPTKDMLIGHSEQPCTKIIPPEGDEEISKGHGTLRDQLKHSHQDARQDISTKRINVSDTTAKYVSDVSDTSLCFAARLHRTSPGSREIKIDSGNKEASMVSGSKETCIVLGNKVSSTSVRSEPQSLTEAPETLDISAQETLDISANPDSCPVSDNVIQNTSIEQPTVTQALENVNNIHKLLSPKADKPEISGGKNIKINYRWLKKYDQSQSNIYRCQKKYPNSKETNDSQQLESREEGKDLPLVEGLEKNNKVVPVPRKGQHQLPTGKKRGPLKHRKKKESLSCKTALVGNRSQDHLGISSSQQKHSEAEDSSLCPGESVSNSELGVQESEPDNDSKWSTAMADTESAQSEQTSAFGYTLSAFHRLVAQKFTLPNVPLFDSTSPSTEEAAPSLVNRLQLLAVSDSKSADGSVEAPSKDSAVDGQFYRQKPIVDCRGRSARMETEARHWNLLSSRSGSTWPGPLSDDNGKLRMSLKAGNIRDVASSLSISSTQTQRTESFDAARDASRSRLSAFNSIDLELETKRPSCSRHCSKSLVPLFEVPKLNFPPIHPSRAASWRNRSPVVRNSALPYSPSSSSSRFLTRLPKSSKYSLNKLKITAQAYRASLTASPSCASSTKPKTKYRRASPKKRMLSHLIKNYKGSKSQSSLLTSKTGASIPVKTYNSSRSFIDSSTNRKISSDAFLHAQSKKATPEKPPNGKQNVTRPRLGSEPGIAKSVSPQPRAVSPEARKQTIIPRSQTVSVKEVLSGTPIMGENSRTASVPVPNKNLRPWSASAGQPNSAARPFIPRPQSAVESKKTSSPQSGASTVRTRMVPAAGKSAEATNPSRGRNSSRTTLKSSVAVSKKPPSTVLTTLPPSPESWSTQSPGSRPQKYVVKYLSPSPSPGAEPDVETLSPKANAAASTPKKSPAWQRPPVAMSAPGKGHGPPPPLTPPPRARPPRSAPSPSLLAPGASSLAANRAGSKSVITEASSRLLLRAIGLALRESTDGKLIMPEAVSGSSSSSSVRDLVTVATRLSADPVLMASLLNIIVQPLSSL